MTDSNTQTGTLFDNLTHFTNLHIPICQTDGKNDIMLLHQVKHGHHLRRIQQHSPFGQKQTMSRNGYSLETSVYQFTRLLQKAGVTILTHATYKKTVRIARGYILQIVILETINELLHHHSGRHLGIIHVGKKHFSRVTAIYHKRGKHLTYLTQKFRTATIGRQGMNGHAIDHCVLS